MNKQTTSSGRLSALPVRFILSILFSFAALVLTASAGRADSLSLVTSASSQAATDSIAWSQLGGDQAILPASFNVSSVNGTSVGVSLAGPNSVVSVVCGSSPCSWTGSGFTANHRLLWTSDAANGGNGPVVLSFPQGMDGAGALIQADTPGAFTAEIQAFNGNTSLGSYTVKSSGGNAVYIGVKDTTAGNITAVVFSLSACAGTCTDFALDTVGLNGAPVASLSATSLAFGSKPQGVSSTSQAVKITNTGTASLTVSSVAISGDFSDTNNCVSSSPIAVNGSCTINVTFKPTTTGTRTGTVTVTDNAGGTPQSIPLSGTGTSDITLSKTSLVFPTTSLTTTSAGQAVTVSNVGASTVTISSYGIGGTDSSDFTETNTCGSSIAAGKSCTITVSFKPTAIGTRTASVQINDNGGASPQTIAVSGVATQLKFSSWALTFPATVLATSSAAQKVTVTNAGSTSVSLSSIALGGTNKGDFALTNGCSTSLAASASCTLTLTFKPAAINTRTATVSLTDNGGGSPQVITLTGTGTQISLSPTSLTFSTTKVGSSSTSQSVTVKNVGSSTVSISSIGLTGADSGDFSFTKTCGTTLAGSDATCSVTVTFKPKATGTRTAAVAITDNGGASPQSIALTGTGD